MHQPTMCYHWKSTTARGVKSVNLLVRWIEIRAGVDWLLVSVYSWQPSVLWKETSLFLPLCAAAVLSHSWGFAYVFMCTWKLAFQHSCVLFNLLSQKPFNPFHIIILLILVPKWYHLEQKSALSPTNTIRLTTGSCSLLFESHHYKLRLAYISVYFSSSVDSSVSWVNAVTMNNNISVTSLLTFALVLQSMSIN